MEFKEKSNGITVISQVYPLLNGKRKKLVKQVGDGSIIRRFDKTDKPKKSTDVVCPHFLELKWAYGCPYNCSWCYLKGTLRFLPGKTKPVVKNYEKIKRHLEAFFDATKQEEILNTGELADSLMWENNGNPFSKFIIPLFENEDKHKVLFLTKSNNIKNLLRLEHNGCSVISFTVNAYPVSRKWEKGAPHTMKRIAAAKKLDERGYKVRLRIDPMVPIKNWKKYYIQLIDRIFSSFEPERITISSLRGLQTTINNVLDKSWTKYLSEKSNWGKKIDFKTRHEMYKTIIDYLKENYNYKSVGLCKETIEMWNRLNMNYREIRCNCIW